MADIKGLITYELAGEMAIMKRSERFYILNNLLKTAVDGYGGASFELPPNHSAGLVVPKGGSSCANCKYGDSRTDGPHCTSSYWVRWHNGNSRLPVDDPETYCSDFWEPK